MNSEGGSWRRETSERSSPRILSERFCDGWAIQARSKLSMEKSGSSGPVSVRFAGTPIDFDPEKDGAITAAEKLTSGKGAWVLVWEALQGSSARLSRHKKAAGIQWPD